MKAIQVHLIPINRDQALPALRKVLDDVFTDNPLPVLICCHCCGYKDGPFTQLIAGIVETPFCLEYREVYVTHCRECAIQGANQ